MNFWQRLRRMLLVVLIVVWCLAAATAIWFAEPATTPNLPPSCLTNCL